MEPRIPDSQSKKDMEGGIAEPAAPAAAAEDPFFPELPEEPKLETPQAIEELRDLIQKNVSGFEI